MDPIRVARAAGILEGEGSFLTKSGRKTPVVTCQMTDLDVLQELKDLFGGSLVSTKTREDHHKPTWRWTIQGVAAATVMNKLRPHMFGRRKEAIDKALLTWDTTSGEREAKEAIVQAAAVAYLNKEGSLRELSERFGVSYETIRRRVWLID